ncbi:MAG: hypothetical protein WBB45_03375 [Cyclobacteriaceae bacterium]
MTDDQFEKDYAAWFNQGYELGLHDPVLSKQLQSIESSSERMMALKKGMDQSRLDREKLAHKQVALNRIEEREQARTLNTNHDKAKGKTPPPKDPTR